MLVVYLLMSKLLVRNSGQSWLLDNVLDDEISKQFALVYANVETAWGVLANPGLLEVVICEKLVAVSADDGNRAIPVMARFRQTD